VIRIDHASVSKPESPARGRLGAGSQPDGHHALKIVIHHTGRWRPGVGDGGKSNPMRGIDRLDESLRTITVEEMDLIPIGGWCALHHERADSMDALQIDPEGADLRVPPPELGAVGFKAADENLSILHAHGAAGDLRLRNRWTDPHSLPVGPGTLPKLGEFRLPHLDDRAISANGGRALSKRIWRVEKRGEGQDDDS